MVQQLLVIWSTNLYENQFCGLDLPNLDLHRILISNLSVKNVNFAWFQTKIMDFDRYVQFDPERKLRVLNTDYKIDYIKCP